MKNLKRLWMSLFLVLALVLSTQSVSAQSKIQVYINGEKLANTESVTGSNENVMLPLKDVMNVLGGTVTTNSKTKLTSIKYLDKQATVTAGKLEGKINGKTYKLAIKPVEKNGKLYVPSKFIGDALGKEVYWNSKANTLTMHDKVKNQNIRYAKKFSIKYLGRGNKLVTDSLNKKLLLVPYGNDVPKNVKYDQLVRTPIKKAVVGSATQISLLDALEGLDAVAGVTNPIDTWEIPEIKSKLAKKQVKNVGDGMSINFELLQALKPSMIFMTSAWDDTAKYKELGFAYTGCFEYEENTNLGRLESIRFVGAFVNKDAMAEYHMNKQMVKLEAVKQKVKAVKTKKKVMWGSYSSYDKAYIVAPKDSYIAEMVSLAGGEYVGNKVTEETKKLSAEKYYLLVKNADLMVSSSMPRYGGPETVKALVKETPILADTKIAKNGNVWYQAPNFYQDLANTADYVEDLAAMIYPEYFKSTKVDHFVKMAK